MKNQPLILVFVVSLITTFASAQSENKLSDSVNSARQIILQNSGEKNLNSQIKREQMSKHPELLTTDSSKAVVDTKRTKSKGNKHKK